MAGLPNDFFLFKTIASGSSSKLVKLVRLCDRKTAPFSSHALNWAVIEACKIGHVYLLKYLLQDGSRLELRDDNGNTPLMICSRKGYPEMVKMLLKLGADVNAKNNHGDTALMLARSREAIECLLKDKRIQLDEQDSNGNTALMSAIQKSHLQKVGLLIGVGADPNRKVTLVNKSNQSAFDVAELLGLKQLLELLCSAKEVNSNPLLFAAVENDFESCIKLLKYNFLSRRETLSIRPDILCCVLKQIQYRETILSTDIELVRQLCKLGINVNRCQCCAESRMELVLNIGSCALAEVLCDHGAQVTHNDLVSAVNCQQIKMIPLLVKYGAPVNDYDFLGRLAYKGSALDTALEKSLTSAASVLLEHGAKLDPEYALIQALMNDDKKIITFLLKKCDDAIKAVVEKPEIFIQAVKLGDIHKIQLLLDAGVDIDRVYDSKTPLMRAVHTEVINYLLDKGANVNFKTNTTPLINAVSLEYYYEIVATFHWKLKQKEIEDKVLQVIDALLSKGANLEDTDVNGCTALIASVNSKFNVEIPKYLLEKGADVNRSNVDGLTALHMAAEYEKASCVEVLLKHGAVVNLKSLAGFTPLHNAVLNVDIVKMLLDKHADVNVKDNSGNTPLSLVSKYWGDMVDVVKLLIAAGSDVNHRNDAGMSPLWLAADSLNTNCLSYLIYTNADLGHDDRLQKSALSITFDKWYPSEETQRTATILLDFEASAEFVRPDIIHRLIAAGNDGTLVQKLIKTGICPTDIVLQKTIFSWPETSISPLAVSLILDNVEFAHYFIENWFLTKSDVKLLSNNMDILSNLALRECKALPYLEEVSRQPMRLELLSFIAVSSAIGSDRDRRQRVHNSKLPVLMQEQLLFSKVEEKALKAVSGEGNFFLYQLTRHQTEQEEKCSSFYEMDEDFGEMMSRWEPSFVNLDYAAVEALASIMDI